MNSTWIESPARGRQGGPVRAGMWSTVVVGTHPIEEDQAVWLELIVDEQPMGLLPAYWLENKGVNSLWHVPIPPQSVERRLRYRSVARRGGENAVNSGYQEVVVRPNLPDATETSCTSEPWPEGLVGNRRMTVKVDARGATFDIIFPTVGMHREVRPAAGERPQSRAHLRAIVGGLYIERRLDWFDERLSWQASQAYVPETNVLATNLTWRHGPVRVRVVDFAVMGADLPRTDGGSIISGQYIKRFEVANTGEFDRQMLFGLYVHAEVNGGIGDPGLSWDDGHRVLLAVNRGHTHVNRKLARDATIELAVALNGGGDIRCEAVGPQEAMLLRWIDVPAGGSTTVDVLVSTAYTGWRGDHGTFTHWIRPALSWFREVSVQQLEAGACAAWVEFLKPVPRPAGDAEPLSQHLRRSVLVAALHVDEHWGAVASGYDRGLNAYCWPRVALATTAALARSGRPELGRRLFQWLFDVAKHNRNYLYWYQKYTIDGYPEWETPAVDQTALIPWSLERHYKRTGDRNLVESLWPMVEWAVSACSGTLGHPGLAWNEELALVSSAGVWDSRFGAFLYSNACIVAGLRSAIRLAQRLGRTQPISAWNRLAEKIWTTGILKESRAERNGPGLYDPDRKRFLEARRVSRLRGLWSNDSQNLIERSSAFDVSTLGLAIPFGLLPASDPRMRRSAEEILTRNATAQDANALRVWSPDADDVDSSVSPGEPLRHDASSLATLWMVRYLIQLSKETGEEAPLARAQQLLEDMIARLGSLGLSVNPGRLSTGKTDRPYPTAGVWELHAMLIEVILDLHGLDYDVPEQTLQIEPVFPTSWTSTAGRQVLPCGEVAYDWKREPGERPAHRFTIEACLTTNTRVCVELSCPGTPVPESIRVTEGLPRPSFDKPTRRLSWQFRATAGTGRWSCEWR